MNDVSSYYIYNSYSLFEAFRRGDWSAVRDILFSPPLTPLIHMQSAALNFFVQPARYAAVSLGFIYYLSAQVATYWFFRRLCRSPAAGLAAVFMLLACGRPFADGIGAPDADVAVFSLYILASYAVALTNTFGRPASALILPMIFAFCCWCDAALIPGFILFFILMFLCLAGFYFQQAGEIRGAALPRLRNLALAAAVFALTVAPLLLNGGGSFNFEPAAELSTSAGALLRKTMSDDFGPAFWAGLAGLTGLAWRLRGDRKPAVEPAATDADAESRRDQVDFNLYCLALLLFGVSGFAADVAAARTDGPFAGPLLVLLLTVCLLWATDQIRAGLPRRDERTTATATKSMICAAALAAVATQAAFYAAPGRNRPVRGEMNTLAEMFDDIRRYAARTGTTEPVIVSDVGGGYAVGGLLSWNLFVYEKYGELPPARGRLIGDDTPWPEARARLDAADVVVLSGSGYAADPAPDSAPAALRTDMRRHVEDGFRYCGAYALYEQDSRAAFRRGGTHGLYIRTRRPERPDWTITASSAAAPEFGPETLLQPGGAIWHAAWDGGPQWVMLETPVPVSLRGLSITAQDGRPERAPMDFMLQASDDGAQWRTLLEAVSISYRKRQTRTWSVEDGRRHRYFRLYVTANGDDSPLLTIQHLALDVAPTRESGVCR